jgi:8-oxo-dGTP pyrophosphatase MutT (NUDIX family)
MNQDTEIDEGRTVLLAALERYRERYPDEAAVIERFADFVRREPGCFQRSTTEGHVTGSAWVVDAAGERTLLTHHRKLDKWLQLGGHADGESDVVAVALMEAREESGIDDLTLVDTEIFDLDIHPIPARGADPEHLHFDVRYVIRAAHTDHVVSDESHDLAWVRVDAIAHYTTEPSMLRMASKWNALNGRS